MQSKKAYILKTEHGLSRKYARNCADSCEKVGLDWEYFRGWSNMRGVEAWALSPINLTLNEGRRIILPEITEPRQFINDEDLPAAEKAECCTVGHASIWKKIAEGDEDVGIVLEHDALMLHNIDIEIPQNRIVVLGYKITN